MNDFTLNHGKEILQAQFRWARDKPNYQHCCSIEWKYDNGSRESTISECKYKDEAMVIASRVLGLMSKSLPKRQKLLLAHFKTTQHERKISRSLNIPYQCYDYELDNAILSFYNQLKRKCGDEKFARLFIV